MQNSKKYLIVVLNQFSDGIYQKFTNTEYEKIAVDKITAYNRAKEDMRDFEDKVKKEKNGITLKSTIIMIEEIK